MTAITQQEIDILQALPESCIVIDGGAAIGDWTASVLAIRPNAKVYAFEPLPRHVKTLTERFCTQRNVQIIPKAISDNNTVTQFWLDEEEPGYGSGLFRRIEIMKQRDAFHKNALQIETVALGDLSILHVDMLKLDLEGAEFAALKGLKNLRPEIIQFEYGGCWLDSKSLLSDAYDLLISYGYENKWAPNNDYRFD